MNKVAVFGAGSWGTTLALHLSRKGRAVRLWDRDELHLARLAAERTNARHVPGEKFPDSLEVASDFESLLEAEAAVFVVPSGAMRELAGRIRGAAPGWSAVPVSASKGFEAPGGLRMSQVLQEALPKPAARRIVVLAGPSLAREVARGLPVTLVAAGPEPEAAGIQELFSGLNVRVYTNPDVAGVELAGALKNVIAIAAGIVDGLELGDNAKGALVARGLAEMVRLGVALGARPETFYGLCGVGDLVTTAGSGLSRNHQVGIGLAKGRELSAVLDDLGMVAEGVPTARAALELARGAGVEMPITKQVCAVLFSKKDPRRALEELMSRGLKPEFRTGRQE
jgi:glycerol-3-phosphate dehydrogenase (NAD(P)+)